MDSFVGRSKELSILEDLFSRPGSGTCAVYGRRRMGKTALLKEFCRNKRSIFLSAAETDEAGNCERFSRAIEEQTGKRPPETDRFFKILDFIKHGCIEEKTVLVIDEYPFLAVSDGISSDVQRFIDHDMDSAHILLIICGSSISAMSEEISGGDRPLFGRFPNRIKLRQMSYRECRMFHQNMNAEDNMSLFLIIGGVPFYHVSLKERTFEACIKRGFLEDQAFLLGEADSMVDREMSPSVHHRAILSAIAGGSTQLKKIAEKCGISPQLCQKYLRNLISLDCAEIVTPMGNAPKHPIYRICDHLLAFHNAVIIRNGNLIETAGPEVSFRRISADISSHMGHMFENVCRSYICDTYPCIRSGKWWGRIRDTDTDIDAVAVITEGRNDRSLFAECKYTSKKMQIGDMMSLIERSSYVKGLMNADYCLFSRSGFAPSLEEAAEERGVKLIGLDDMYGIQADKVQ
ncbi:MAG: AAA family ATPase [Candidatus Methanoplasma sp.]|nr:AAA family ATPase [Candidatus Methanoplasma sp.]